MILIFILNGYLLGKYTRDLMLQKYEKMSQAF